MRIRKLENKGNMIMVLVMMFNVLSPNIIKAVDFKEDSQKEEIVEEDFEESTDKLSVEGDEQEDLRGIEYGRFNLEESDNLEEEQGQELNVDTFTISSKYVLAKDSDFSGTSNGNFRYIGTDEYVEIPHTIRGINITSYASMFRETGEGVKGVKSTNSNVTDMSNMFRLFKGNATLDLSEFYTGSVTNMGGMFAGEVSITSNIREVVGMENWDTKNLQDVRSMFSWSSVNKVTMTKWNTESLIYMSSMFTHFMGSTIDFRGIDTSKVRTMSSMFYAAGRLNVRGIEDFDTGNVTSMNSMFYSAAIDDIDIGGFNTSNVTDMGKMFFSFTTNVGLDVSGFDTRRVTSMEHMFYNVNKFRGTENFNTSNVRDMASMFSGSRANKIDVTGFDTRRVTNMINMFSNTGALEIKGLAGFDTTNIKNMNMMFRNTRAKSLDLSSFNTRRVEQMEDMFRDSDAELLDLRSFETEKVVNMKDMFLNAKANSFYLDNFDTTYVSNMENMFRNTRIRDINLGSFNLENVDKTDNMFGGSSVKNITVNTSIDNEILRGTKGLPVGVTINNVHRIVGDKDFIGTTNMSFRYVGNSEYVEIPSKINGVNVTSYRGMFEGTSVKGVVSRNKNVTDMREMFKDTTSKTIKLVGLDTENVEDMGGMFKGSKSEELDLRGMVSTNVTSMEGMFENTLVKEIDIGSFDLSKVTNIKNMLKGTKAIKGYVRTKEELDRLNTQSGKPNTLNLDVWGITVASNPKGWTNKVVDLKVESVAGDNKIRETEFINNYGENLLRSNHFNINSINTYNRATVKRTNNIRVEEWGTEEAVNFKTVRGVADFQLYWGVSDTGEWLGMEATHSMYVKNKGNHNISVGYNGLNGANTHTIRPGFSGRISSTGTFRTSHSFIQFLVRSVGDIDATFFGHKIELGDEVTDYTPPIPTTTEEGTFPVYNNGTYIFRSLDSRGETRTVAHTVSNIDRVSPKIKVTPSATGWTAQDVTLYVIAEDNLSGVDYIVLPNGQKVNKDEVEYKVSKNGNYTFKVVDKAGNEEVITQIVENIDKSRPEIKVSLDNSNWTRDDVKVTVQSEKSESGLIDITTINSNLEVGNLSNNARTYVAKENGLYTFKATYSNGATSEATVNVINIDREAPTVVVKNNPEDWAEDDFVDLEITAVDTQSGLKSITLPNREVITGKSTVKYKVSENGLYKFIVEDNIGNKKAEVVVVDKMMIQYSFYVRDKEGKPVRGIGYELRRDGVVHSRVKSNKEGLVDFGKIPTTGSYTLKQINSDERTVIPEEVGVDPLKPKDMVSNLRGDRLPSTGTYDIIIVVSLIGVMTVMVVVVDKNKRS